MKELSNKLRKIAYDMSFKHTPFEIASTALAAYVRQFGNGDPREDATYQQLRADYDKERDARQAKYRKKFERAAIKLTILKGLTAVSQMLDGYVEDMSKERKEIRAIINLLCGHTREWNPQPISNLPVFPEVR